MTNIVNAVSLISGLMTIMGITGVLSWGLSGKPKETSNIALYILTLMFRGAVCIIVIACFVWPFVLFRSWLSFMFFGGPSGAINSIEDPLLWWLSDYSISYILGYLVSIPITLVIIVPCIASIWLCRLTPFKTMWKYLTMSE
ncbi:hypothetical protein AB7102_00675 [Providencia manganoxydans]|uniref:hypothetical protein n=1 Tax=Providencia manganoxydans TaxID=2923283 RepID=UPI0034E3E165